MKSVRCSEFRGGRFSEVANVLHKRAFQSVTATLSAVGSVSASRSVRSGRFYCISLFTELIISSLISFKMGLRALYTAVVILTTVCVQPHTLQWN